MKANGVLLTVLAATLVAACTTTPKVSNETKPVTKTITGTELKVRDLWGYRIVASYKDYLFMQEDRDTSRLVVYKVEGDSLIYHKGLIDRGHGPKEFYYVEFSLGEDTLYISNSDPTGLKAFYSIPLNDMDRIDDRDLWKEYPVSERDIQTGLSFVPYQHDNFVVAGGKADTKEIFSLFDYDEGEKRIPIQFWPDDQTPGPLFAKQMVYMQSYLCSRGDRFLYANMYARYMFVAEIKENGINEIAMVYSSLPKYEIKSDGNSVRTADGDEGIRPYATSTRIYAKIGKLIKEIKDDNYKFKDYPRGYLDELEVYDWDGNFIDNYRTSLPFSTFAVSYDNKYLYTMTMDLDSGQSVIIRYDL